MSRLVRWFRVYPVQRPLAAGFLALALFAAIQANWHHPMLRFESTLLNHFFLLLAFTFPWIAAGAFLFLPRGWGKVLALLLTPVLFTPRCARGSQARLLPTQCVRATTSSSSRLARCRWAAIESGCFVPTVESGANTASLSVKNGH
jgi:hypothetical protein